MDTNPTPGASSPNVHFLADWREPAPLARSLLFGSRIFLHRRHRGVHYGRVHEKKVGSGSCVGSLVAVCARSGSAISNPHFLQIPILLRLRLDRRAEGALRRPRGARGARDGTLRRARLRRPCVRRGRRCGATPGARAPSCTHQRRLTPACSPSRRVLPRRRRAGAPRLSGRPPASRQSAWGAPGAGGARCALRARIFLVVERERPRMLWQGLCRMLLDADDERGGERRERLPVRR